MSVVAQYSHLGHANDPEPSVGHHQLLQHLRYDSPVDGFRTNATECPMNSATVPERTRVLADASMAQERR